MSHIIIVNRRPGMIRGGHQHPAVAAHASDAFAPEQWADIVREPEMTVVAGIIITHATLADHLPQTAKKVGKA